MTDRTYPVTFAYQDKDGTRYVIKSDGAGGLECMACRGRRNAECSHPLLAIRAGSDAEELWDRTTNPRTSFARIPIMPTLGIESTVKLEPLEGGTDVARVSISNWFRSLEDVGLTEFMGFLNRGEGRIHLRQMVINWFEPALDINKLECKSRHHAWSARALLSRDFTVTPDRTKMFAHAWRILFNGKCSYCLEKNEQFDPDLVPRV